MVIKGEKPTVVTLAHGPILTTELAEVIKAAWSDRDNDWPTSNRVSIDWDSGHEATVRNFDSLQPIEDAESIASIYGTFRYSDNSDLSLYIHPYGKNTVTAKGSIARSRQSEITQLWAAFPDRGKLNPPTASALWLFGALLMCFVILGTLYTHFFIKQPPTLLDWLVTAGMFLIGAASLLLARSTATQRAKRHPVVFHRQQKDPPHFWAALAGIVGIAALIVAVLTWLYPRK